MTSTKLYKHLFLLSLLLVAIALLTTGRVHASIDITEYSTPTPTTSPGFISIGLDKHMWFIKPEEKKVVKLSADGQMTEFPVTQNLQGGRYFGINPKIILGPDGNMWFTSEEIRDNNGEDETKDYINKITPSGIVTSYEFSTESLPITSYNNGRNKTPFTITGGVDGNLWITAGRIEDDDDARYGLIAKMDTSGHILNFYEQTDDARASSSIISREDGNLWFLPGNAIKKISTNGEVTRYPLRNRLNIMMMSMPIESYGGDLWFYAFERDTNDLNKIKSYLLQVSITGAITEHRLDDNTFIFTIANTADDSIWFVDQKISQQGEVTPPISLELSRLDPSTSLITHFSVPYTGLVIYITTGSDGNIWGMTEAGKVIKLTFSGDDIKTSIKPPKTGDITILVLTISSFLAVVLSIFFLHRHVVRRT